LQPPLFAQDLPLDEPSRVISRDQLVDVAKFSLSTTRRFR
jgi:hypothetical protein